MSATVVLLATVETKNKEAQFLQGALKAHGVEVRVVDISLHSHGVIWDGPRKVQAMDEVGARVGADLHEALDGSISAVVGLGGGTGGEIILRVMQALPFAFPKILITTLPFDPRIALADNSIILVPTLADIAGLNATLRQVLATSAAMIAGLCQMPADQPHVSDVPSVGITALGATAGAAEALVAGLRALGEESTVFHANGYGGAAFARFASCGAFKAVIDMTCHELTRWMFAGAHVPMPTRFSAAGHLPQVVLPGALNFIGLGEIGLVPRHYLDRQHYQHSGFFTHVKLTEAEMQDAASALADHLNAAEASVHVIVPMGGFSHQDCPGGAIEDAGLRQVCLDVLTANARHFTLQAVPHHINAPETAARVIDVLKPKL